MKAGSIVCLVLFVLAAGLFLAQMWFSIMEAESFVKTIVDEKKMKDSGYID